MDLRIIIMENLNIFRIEMIKILYIEDLWDKVKVVDSGKYKILNVYIRKKGWKINELSIYFKLEKWKKKISKINVKKVEGKS